MRKISMYQLAISIVCAALFYQATGRCVSARATSAGADEPAVVQALFNLSAPAKAPFPSNRFTIFDPSQNTERRVNLPKPDCAARPSDCEDLEVINTLDGFNLQPRLSIPFDGPIDLTTVNSQTVFLVNLGSDLTDGNALPGAGRIIGINQVVWDSETNTLHAESDELLDQHTCYLLIVKSGIRDQSGNPVRATADFRRFVLAPPFDLFFGKDNLNCRFGQDCGLRNYRSALIKALKNATQLGVSKSEIMSAAILGLENQQS